MMQKRDNNLVTKNFGKCLKLGRKRFQIVMLYEWADGSRVLEQRQRMLLRHKSSSYNSHEIRVEWMTTEVNVWDDDE